MPSYVRILTVLAMLGVSAGVHAQTRAPGYGIDQLELSERGSEWFSTDSLDLRGSVRPAIGVVGEWAYRPLVVTDGGGDLQRSIVRNQFVLHPGASLVLADRLRLAIDVPVQTYADGHAVTINGVTYAPPADKTSLGDLRLGATVRLFGEYGDPITGALGVQVSMPTGARDSYASDGSTRITPLLAVAGDIGAFVYAAQSGVTIRTTDDSFERTRLGPYFNLALSAGVRLCDRRWVIGPEFFLHSVLTHDQFFKKRTTPMEGLIGTHLLVVDGLRLGGGVGFGLTSGYGAPDRRVLLGLEWVPPVPEPEPVETDRDHDGIPDSGDACPDVPGMRSDDPAKNGCPPPADLDHDGILDADDACPTQPGVRSDDPAKNGCPQPLDRDHDGILDADDACPEQPGEPSSDASKNGCPPPPDRDHDGILDADDACPDEPGKPDSNPQRNGCPKAFVRGAEIKILDQVKFKTNSAEIEPGPDSEEVLQAVLSVLNSHPEVLNVTVEGHTDSRGSAAYNRKLSKNRAKSVVSWLTAHGIDPKRLTSEGFGPDRPIDTNETEEGRRNNRRVEFHIAETAPKPQP
jgi:outer membrane protein OmpA-like peptidoglycan-associated protein